MGAGFTGDPKESVLETLDYLITPGGATETRSLVCHCLLSTVIFPKGINSFLFDLLISHPGLFALNSLMKQWFYFETA